MGIIGMIQVLAARAHPIQEVYQATSNWTMPELRAGETQLEQSDREIASWRLNHAGHWQEQTEPPLSIFYLKTKVGGKSADMKPVRLRLILVSAADVRGAESWLGPLKTCRDSGQIYPWMPRQNTESLLLWAYATDGDSRPFLWLGPKSADDAQTMTLRHWLLNKEVPTFPLPADAVAKRYRPWPKGLRADSLPWFDSPLVQGASRLRYTDKAQMQRPGHTGRKALATKKKAHVPFARYLFL